MAKPDSEHSDPDELERMLQAESAVPWVETRTDNEGNLKRATMSVSEEGFPYLAIQVCPMKGRPRSYMINGETEQLREDFSDMVRELHILNRKKKETT